MSEGDMMSPAEEAKAAAMRQYEAAFTEVSRYVGCNLLIGVSMSGVRDGLIALRDQAQRDAIVDSSRVELNPMDWVLKTAIERISALC